MMDFDIIQGMDWLAENHASIDCHKKEVVFSPPSESSIKFRDTCAGVSPKVVSMMKAKRLFQQGGWVILASVVDARGKEKTLNTIPIVNEFLDVFPKDLLGKPSPKPYILL